MCQRAKISPMQVTTLDLIVNSVRLLRLPILTFITAKASCHSQINCLSSRLVFFKTVPVGVPVTCSRKFNFLLLHLLNDKVLWVPRANARWFTTKALWVRQFTTVWLWQNESLCSVYSYFYCLTGTWCSHMQTDAAAFISSVPTPTQSPFRGQGAVEHSREGGRKINK